MHRVVALALVLPACGAHVAFEPAPTAAAPLDVRTHYYETHALAPATRADLAMRTRLGDSGPTVRRRRGTLQNGAVIDDVADLAPLVDEGSATRAAIDDAVQARGTGRAFLLAGAGVGAAGLVTSGAVLAYVIGIVPGQGTVPAPGFSPFTVGAGAAFALGAVGGAGLAAWGTRYVNDEEDAAARAFASYNDDLKRRLALP